MDGGVITRMVWKTCSVNLASPRLRFQKQLEQNHQTFTSDFVDPSSVGVGVVPHQTYGITGSISAENVCFYHVMGGLIGKQAMMGRYEMEKCGYEMEI